MDFGADTRELGLGFFSGVAQIVRHDRAERRLRPVDPDGVDGIIFDRYEACACGSAGFAKPFGGFDRVQPRRIAEPGAGRQVGFDPGRWRAFDQMLDGKNRAVDFLAHLHLIAAIDEQDGAVGQHERDPGRAGEAGQPGEPLGAGRHVFVLVAIGARHDEAVEAVPLEFGPQRRDAGRTGVAVGTIVERLEKGLKHARQCRA